MDIHILYHIILYTIVFIPLALVLGHSFPLVVCLILLPPAGEYLQQTSLLSYFNFSFQYLDMVTNLIGAVIGIGIAYLIRSFK